LAALLLIGFINLISSAAGGAGELLTNGLGMPQSWLAGTGAATHVITGSFADGHGVRRAIALSVGVVAGAQLGARLSLRASGRLVEALLGIALLALAARLFLTVL